MSECILEGTSAIVSGNKGLFSSTAEVSWFLDYQLRAEGTVLYFWSSLRCIKTWIVIYYRGLRFSHRAVVLHVLEGDAACTTILSGQSARKNPMLVLVWCYKSTSDREQDLWTYRLSEAALCSGMTSLQVMAASARRLICGSNEALTLLYLVAWPSALICSDGNACFGKIVDSHHWPHSPFEQEIILSFLYCFSGLLAFCQAVLLLMYVVTTKMWSCPELNPWHIIHILGFITPKFLSICLMIIAALAIFQTWVLVGLCIGKCLILSQIRHFVRLF